MKRRGFTLIELLVVIAIIAILAAILFPVFAKARAKAHTATCASHMREVALGLMMYGGDYDGWLPYNAGCTPAGRILWDGMMQSYMPNKQKVWDFIACRGGAVDNLPYYFGGACGGRYTFNLDSGSRQVGRPVRHPESVMLIGECGTWSSAMTSNGPGSYTACHVHQEKTNMGFQDGHVKLMDPSWLESDLAAGDADDNGDGIADGEPGQPAEGCGAWYWWWR